MTENVSRFPPLYPILDSDLVLAKIAPSTRREYLRSVVHELASSGVEILQYRNKRDPDSVVRDDAHAIRPAAGRMRLVLNDRISLFDPALWDGVHVGQSDLTPREARHLIGRKPILGVSTHNDAQVISADRQSVDYIAIGPVFPTLTKSDTSPVIGLEGVRRARSLTRKPLVAIGGITLANASQVCAAGAHSLAVISAIFSAADPVKSARDFLAVFK